MSDYNPYAPPETAEPEVQSSQLWQLDGISLLVKNNAVLPKVDLETGETTGDMKAVRRILQPQGGPFALLRFAVIVAVVIYMPGSWHQHPFLVYLGIFCALLLFRQAQAVRGNPSQRIFIWEFAGPRTQKGRLARNKWRTVMSLLGTTFILVSFGPSFDSAAEPLLYFGLALVLSSVSWRLLDRPKGGTQPGPPGWLRISPIHQDAVSFLGNLQQESAPPSGHPPASKLIRTTWFYRYPLAMLVGRRKNPFTIFNLFLAKLLRSHQLRRDTYHFSEAEPCELSGLCQHLQDHVGSWIASHPGWRLLSATHLAFPAGDVNNDIAHLASPGLEHHLSISASWNIALPGYLHSECTFTTWLAGGTSIVTYERPFLPLRIPDIQQFRARGGPEQVFQSHLQRISGKPLDPPKDPQEFLSRLDAQRAITDRRLTELGYQSETRESR